MNHVYVRQMHSGWNDMFIEDYDEFSWFIKLMKNRVECVYIVLNPNYTIYIQFKRTNWGCYLIIMQK
jgi:hypothetical protein